jgi:polyhydroxyalkanoate synthesis regulator phasin
MNGVTQWEAKEIIREKNATIEAQAAEIERLREEVARLEDQAQRYWDIIGERAPK